MAAVDRSALGGKPSAIAIPEDSCTNELMSMLYERLDGAGIDYAVILEKGVMTLYVASFDETNVRGIIEYLRSKEVQE